MVFRAFADKLHLVQPEPIGIEYRANITCFNDLSYIHYLKNMPSAVAAALGILREAQITKSAIFVIAKVLINFL